MFWLKFAVFLLMIIPQLTYAEMLQDDLFEEITLLYDERGNENYMIAEEVTQREHVLQSAFIASFAGAPEEIIIALLLHDIGQIIDEATLGNTNILHACHDELGAAWLNQKGFPAKVVDGVRFHAIAKIILCDNDPEYYQNLSQASKDSYHVQKAKYTAEEGKRTLREFYENPFKEEYLRMRKCDDLAKIIGFNETTEQALPGFGFYKTMLERVRKGKGKSASNPFWKDVIDAMHQLAISNRTSFEKLLKSMNRFANVNKY